MKPAWRQVSWFWILVSELSNQSLGFGKSDVESNILIFNRSCPQFKSNCWHFCMQVTSGSYLSGKVVCTDYGIFCLALNLIRIGQQQRSISTCVCLSACVSMCVCLCCCLCMEGEVGWRCYYGWFEKQIPAILFCIVILNFSPFPLPLWFRVCRIEPQCSPACCKR